MSQPASGFRSEMTAQKRGKAAQTYAAYLEGQLANAGT